MKRTSLTMAFTAILVQGKHWHGKKERRKVQHRNKKLRKIHLVKFVVENQKALYFYILNEPKITWHFSRFAGIKWHLNTDCSCWTICVQILFYPGKSVRCLSLLKKILLHWFLMTCQRTCSIKMVTRIMKNTGNEDLQKLAIQIQVICNEINASSKHYNWLSLIWMYCTWNCSITLLLTKQVKPMQKSWQIFVYLN